MIGWPGSLYFALLFSRLAKTCASRVRSPLTSTGASGACSVNRPASDAALVSWASLIALAMSIGSHRISTLPVVMRATSSRSSTRRTICPTCHSMICRAVDVCDASFDERRMCSPELIGASGLRSSWASVARNSSLRRSASCSASSARFLAVTSMPRPYNMAGDPLLSYSIRHRD